jgi:hypothetical protein
MPKNTPQDLLQPDDWVQVNRADLDELIALAEKEGIHMPDGNNVTRIHYSEKLSDEGTVHEFHWTGTKSDPWTIGTRLDYPIFKRRMLNTLPMLREASNKRGYLLYLKLAKQQAAHARKEVNRFLRGKAKGDVAILKHVLEVLDRVDEYKTW